ncbi:hypothetical protein BHX94_11830 [Macrococcoides bohemicum]|uniref:Gram-positive cocci surface proteins LPxTG domain-containing protein n=1 Tax=Macrococcoides bohemicum TaxID=1903056 RepID=A0A328A0K2_9STAP|nr:SdrD B-like domain-containing protein [Macrococcus bohemicus]RAK48029.1 hypothetical protein BHX94_11830 [Macrococcus bohemicus]
MKSPVKEAPTTETPTTEAPTTEAPTTETPTTEAPTTEAPTTEEPGKNIYSISHFVWNDKNKNGVQDSDEIGISGVTVILTKPDRTKISVVTDQNGHYIFTGLENGEYTVEFVVPDGFEASPTGQSSLDKDSNGKVTKVIINNSNDDTVDMGMFKLEGGGTPTTELPTTELPTTELPTTELPTTELPTTELPTTELPTTEVPTTELPTMELPTTEVPTTEAPTTEEPTTEEPTIEIPKGPGTSVTPPAPTNEIPNKPSLPEDHIVNIKPVPSKDETFLPDTGEVIKNTGLAGLAFISLGGMLLLLSRRKN